MNTPVNRIDAVSHEEIELLLPWFVNGTLSASEHRRVAAHLSACTDCDLAVQELRQVASAVGRPGITPIVPEPNADALLERLDARDRHPFWRRPLAVAAVALAALVAAFVFLGNLDVDVPGPVQFNTVTQDTDVSQMALLFEVTFSNDVSVAERVRILERFGLRADGSAVNGTTYRLHATRLEASPADINALTERLAAAEGVVSATVEMLPPAAAVEE